MDGRRGDGGLSGTILVTGATSVVGRAALLALSEAGVPCRAGTRDPTRAPAVPPGVRWVTFDDAHSTTVEDALAGVDAVFLITPLAEDMVPRTRAVVEQILRARVRRVVRLSALGAGSPATTMLGQVHREAEILLEGRVPEWTMLRPNGFMQNYTSHHRHSIVERDAFYLPQGDGRVSVVDARDIAAVAVAALTQAGHAGRAYELTGPAPLSNDEIAEMLSVAIGRSVRYVDVHPAQARAALSAGGVPAWLVGVIAELCAVSAAGLAAAVSPDVAAVLGRPPIPFERFARDHAHLLREPGR
jgi:uncharacterized protein YbjT (DUF2867 family)